MSADMHEHSQMNRRHGEDKRKRVQTCENERKRAQKCADMKICVY